MRGPQESNGCVKGDEAEGSWQECPGPWEKGGGFLVEAGKSVPVFSSSLRVQLRQHLFQSFPGFLLALEAPFVWLQ